jgi:nanoRNase/pAp phosphatase (c-di-AMP/oligoRNAs hydrolase)
VHGIKFTVINLNSLSLSFRTDRQDIDVSQVAVQLSGGGRSTTAGAELSRELVREFIDKVFGQQVT